MPDPSANSGAWRDEIQRRLEPLGLPATREAEIVDEVAQHLEDRYQELLVAGHSHDDAAASAWRELDETDVLGREVARVEARAPLGLPPPGAPSRGRWFAALWQDVRYAARTLTKPRGFSLTVVLAIALSIGPTTAIVSVGNWLLWRPPPGVSDSDRLAVVWFGNWREDGMGTSWLTYQNLDDSVGRATTAAGIAGVQESLASLSVPGELPRRVGTANVTANFFDVLGVRLRAGRSFQPEEDRLPGTPVAVISQGLARSAFGSAGAALDKTVLLNSRSFTVIGVAPSAFTGISPTESMDVWIPASALGYLNHWSGPPQPARFYSFVIRLAPGAAFSALENELNVLVRHLAGQSEENSRFSTVRARVFPGLGVDPLARPGNLEMVNRMLMIGAVLLLLGCANVANLFVFRTTRRQHEIAVRKALGASRGRLVQVQLVESCMLAISGAALGLGLALLVKQLMQQLLFPRPPGMGMDVPIDGRVLAATIIAALATGVISAAAPAWIAARGGASASISRTGTRTSTRAPKLRSGLAALQLALSLTLLVGALLLVTTLRNLRSVDLGFDPSNLTAMWIDLGSHGYSQERALQYYREVLPALEAYGGFDDVTLAYNPPLPLVWRIRILPPDGDPSKPLMVYANAITHGYFDLLSIPLVRGRAFTPDESLALTAADPPIIVNETLARRLYGTVDVVGRTVRFAKTMSNPARDLVIVGVSRDSHSRGITQGPGPLVYEPLARFELATASFMVRSELPPVKVGEIANAIASRTDSSVPLTSVRALTMDIDRQLSQQRLFAWLLSLLAALGFVLASLGLYGLVAQTTAERTREFGIRMAVGAGRGDIIRLVARYAFVVSAAGVLAGLGLAFFGTRMVESMLFGVTRLDPVVYAAAVGTLVIVVALACIAPALRALRVQPVEVLRAE